MLGLVLALMFAAAVLAVVARSDGPQMTKYAAGALAMHVLFAFGQYWVQEVYYGVSDVHMYAEFAEPIARALDLDFARFAPEVFKLALHFDANLPTPIGQEGGDPGKTMVALTAAIFFLVGTSMMLAFVVVAIGTWAGSLLLAKALVDEVSESERPLVLAGTLMIPSVVFWSSAIVKEAFVMAGLGVLCFSLHRTILKRKLYFLPGIPIGGVMIGTLKPYVLFPLVLAVGAWVFVARVRTAGNTVKIPIGAFVLGAALAIAGLLAMGALFPQFSVDRIGEQAAHQQEIWARDSGTASSNVDIGPAGGGSVIGQLPYVPLALVNSLFRPFLFEARNITMLAAAVETTLITYLFVTTVWRFRLGAVKDEILRSPLLSAAIVYVLVFSIAVGLTTLNLGTLSRYRLPMMPYYLVAVALIRHRLRARVEVPAIASLDETEEVES